MEFRRQNLQWPAADRDLHAFLIQFVMPDFTPDPSCQIGVHVPGCRCGSEPGLRGSFRLRWERRRHGGPRAVPDQLRRDLAFDIRAADELALARDIDRGLARCGAGPDHMPALRAGIYRIARCGQSPGRRNAGVAVVARRRRDLDDLVRVASGDAAELARAGPRARGPPNDADDVCGATCVHLDDLRRGPGVSARLADLAEELRRTRRAARGSYLFAVAMRYPKGDLLDVPGGKRLLGESSVECAFREAVEEVPAFASVLSALRPHAGPIRPLWLGASFEVVMVLSLPGVEYEIL